MVVKTPFLISPEYPVPATMMPLVSKLSMTAASPSTPSTSLLVE